MIVGTKKDGYPWSPTFTCKSEGKKTKASREEKSFQEKKEEMMIERKKGPSLEVEEYIREKNGDSGCRKA